MSTDFFAGFRRPIVLVRYSNGYFSDSGMFFNGCWANLEDSNFSDTQSFSIVFSDNLTQTITIPFDTSIYQTCINIIETLLTVYGIKSFFTPLPKENMVKFGKLGFGDFIEKIAPEHKIESCSILNSSGDVVYDVPFYNSPSISDITACVQPVTGNALITLPEGLRDKDVLHIWTIDKLHTVERNISIGKYGQSGNYPDKVLINGSPYVVEMSQPWIDVPIIGAICVVAQYAYFVTKYQPLKSMVY